MGYAFDAFATATEMLRALRARDASAVELLDLHLERIDRINPALNAVVARDDEAARAAAKEADAARARGEDAPLLGLPLTVKDCIYVRGLPTTGGLPERAGSINDEDSRLAARVRAAGAVFMGTTNVPPNASDWQSDNPVYGRTNNPWDVTRTPGGSSGGAAAALAAGLTPLEFGGDFVGSIRIPAAFCGVYGHKSSETALARSGHFPGPNSPNWAFAMAVQGPMARSADDLDLALGVVAGPEVGEDVAWRLVLPPARQTRLAGYRVAVLPDIPWLPVDREIRDALERLASSLSAAGARVAVAQPDGFGDLRDFFGVYLSLLGATSEAPSVGDHEVNETGWDQEFVAAWVRGRRASAGEYLGFHGARERFRATYRTFFRAWDVLLAPANIVNAFPHTDQHYAHRRLDVDGRAVPYEYQAVYPGLANLTGQPSTAFPVGLTERGLPIGLQAIGPYLEDRTPIRIAALVADEIGGFRAPG
ncbi:MAG: amidase [Thermomicrobiales bacterium]